MPKLMTLARAAVLACLATGATPKTSCGGEGVDVLSAAEGFDQHGILGEMGQEAQLDLRVVGGEQQAAGRGDEGGANLAAELGADGNILQIRIGGAEAAGGGAGLVKRGVQAAGDGVDQVGQRVGVGRFELRELAILDDFLGQSWTAASSSSTSAAVERDLAAAASRRLQVQLVEENFGELLRRVDVEFEAGHDRRWFFRACRFPPAWCAEMRSSSQDRRERRRLPCGRERRASGKSIFS